MQLIIKQCHAGVESLMITIHRRFGIYTLVEDQLPDLVPCVRVLVTQPIPEISPTGTPTTVDCISRSFP